MPRVNSPDGVAAWLDDGSLPHRSWGYFQRRMQLRREADDACSDGVNTAATESAEWRDVAKPQSSYGETSAVWR